MMNNRPYKLQTLTANEYGEINEAAKHCAPEWSSNDANELNKKYLGIYCGTTSGNDQCWKARWLIGHVWLKPDELSLKISAKKIDNKETDFFRMFLDCLSHPVVSQYLDNCYEVFFNDPPLPAKTTDMITPFLIARYLKELHDLTRRLIKQNFHSVVNNLPGRVKGKLLIHRQVRENLTRARPHYAYCSYQVISKDCVENQVLKAALVLSTKYLSYPGGMSNSKLHQWASAGSMALEGVTTRKIFPYDIRTALCKCKGFFRAYRESLLLAEMILKRISFDPSADIDMGKMKCPPYWIDANELFERYCEVKLRGTGAEVKAGYGMKEGGFKVDEMFYADGKKSSSIRPDFLIKLGENALVVDAKFKTAYKEGWIREDIEQLCMYARHRAIRTDKASGLGMKAEKEPLLLFLYPATEGDDRFDIINYVPCPSFIGIYKKPMKVPILTQP